MNAESGDRVSDDLGGVAEQASAGMSATGAEQRSQVATGSSVIRCTTSKTWPFLQRYS